MALITVMLVFSFRRLEVVQRRKCRGTSIGAA